MGEKKPARPCMTEPSEKLYDIYREKEKRTQKKKGREIEI